MKKAYSLCFLFIPFLFSCASSSRELIKWEYEKDAIELHLKSDKQLNYKDKKAHALVICLYQLINPNAFSQLSDSQDGLYKLLECSVFDQASVAVSRQLVVNPGKDVEVTIDRAEGAKYVALVAGYYTIDKTKIIKLYQVPEITRRSGFLWLNKTTKPDKLDIRLTLGSRQLLDPQPEQEAKQSKETELAQDNNTIKPSKGRDK